MGRPHGFIWLMLGLFLGLGCVGAPARSYRCRPNGGGRNDAAADTMARNAAADTKAGDVAAGLVDVPWSADGNSDGMQRDSEPGRDLDLPSADEGEDEYSDAGSDAPCMDGGTYRDRSPWILVGEVPNARQLGGLPLEGGGGVASDSLYRGSTLTSLSQDGCEAFAATGIKTVLDLRSLGEQTSAPAACVTEHANLVSAPLPVPYSVSPADYLEVLYTASSMQTVFAVLADRTAYPVYYHCFYGRDRTGVVTAVILSALGASRQTIQDEYALSGEAGLYLYPKSLDAVLDEIDRIGGIDAYFRVVGVPAEHVQAMRAILVVKPIEADPGPTTNPARGRL